ncbi:nuclear transport factor 2 family protein [Pseudoalteromonas mariniglutinosa]|uniref:nuclear transport factor 2 family protein n=1 Tax=Pseudoalteromonas mariniglutinosa TaxID=206042 RepID=UPI00384A889F
MNDLRTDKFIEIYQKLSKDNLHLLDDIYDPDIQFVDPFHQINGLVDLHNYFAKLYQNVTACHFDISHAVTVNDHAFVYWTMFYRHPKLNRGQQIEVEGHSRLTYVADKIIAHQDYFDGGALLYRHIPILSSIIKYIDKKAAQ